MYRTCIRCTGPVFDVPDFTSGIYVCKIIQRRLHPEFMYVNRFQAAGMPAPALVRSDTPPPPSGSHVMRSDTPPPPCRDNRRNTRPAGSRDCRSTPINLCKNCIFFEFWSFFAGPSRGSGRVRERFLCPKKRFSAKKFYNFFYHIFYKNVYKCLFRPSGDLPDHSGPFRTVPDTYFYIFNVFKYI